MDKILYYSNLITAWLSLFFIVFTALIFIVKILLKNKKTDFLKSIYKFFSKTHVVFGFIAIILGFVHGLLSSESLISLNPATYALILLMLMIPNYYLRKKYSFSWRSIHKVLTLFIVLFTFMHMVHVVRFYGIQIIDSLFTPPSSTTITETPSEIPYSTTSPSQVASSTEEVIVSEAVKVINETLGDGVVLSDGVFRGVADAFGPELTVDVTVADGFINEITIVSHNERNSRFYEPPMRLIPPEIINNQSLDVDIVSGATYTSQGIIDAVKNALTQSIIEGTLN